MSFFGLFGGGDADQIQEYLEKGAIVIDVRTEMEFVQAHAPDSVLMPLDTITQSVEKIQALNKPIILVCLTGARAGSAKRFLQRYGIDAINGGFWKAVLKE
jgi:rhodanese-related sulfurtransferase